MNGGAFKMVIWESDNSSTRDICYFTSCFGSQTVLCNLRELKPLSGQVSFAEFDIPWHSLLTASCLSASFPPLRSSCPMVGVHSSWLTKGKTACLTPLLWFAKSTIYSIQLSKQMGRTSPSTFYWWGGYYNRRLWRLTINVMLSFCLDEEGLISEIYVIPLLGI